MKPQDAPSLFEDAAPRPLADRLRPRALDEVVGQDHLLRPDGPLGRMVASGALASTILWGPPGCGKTTIARLLADHTDMLFAPLSAVFSGVAEAAQGVRRSARPPRRRHRHVAFCRRNPPLQPGAAGRLPARGRGRHRHPGRRHHRESLVRAQRRAALALRGAGAQPARRQRAGDPARPRRGGGGPRAAAQHRCPPHAAGHGRRRRPCAHQLGRSPVRGRRQHAAQRASG